MDSHSVILPKDKHNMMTTEDSRQRLINAVLEQIKADVEAGDITSIEELIRELPADVLMSYLPEY